MTSTDVPICGFRLSTDVLCYDGQSAPESYCVDHEARSGCVSCGRRAGRECPHFVGEQRCGKSLCPDCEHRELGGHGPVVSPTEVIRQGLIAVVEGTLRDAAERGLCTFSEGSVTPISGRVVDDLGTHMILTVMSGLAAGR
jgi:hypothetical protein